MPRTEERNGKGGRHRKMRETPIFTSLTPSCNAEYSDRHYLPTATALTAALRSITIVNEQRSEDAALLAPFDTGNKGGDAAALSREGRMPSTFLCRHLAATIHHELLDNQGRETVSAQDHRRCSTRRGEGKTVEFLLPLTPSGHRR
nr:hypothetical protein Itr_chr05CG14330 [Ipomoea trifida]GLL27350.1 hypothetical protein Itr_chr05CG14340 [Ipomoea trifida]